MSKPDFGRDPERVALAQLMFHAVFPKLKWESMRELGQENYLAMADAAITHFAELRKDKERLNKIEADNSQLSYRGYCIERIVVAATGEFKCWT